jgi:amino-acid N-acetyltransferase
MEIYPRPPEQAARALLEACSLPIDDLAEQDFDNFFGVGAADTLTGLVGLEIRGSIALLRSLAVDPAQRGRGFATALVRRVEEHARSAGVKEIFLLTMTAKPYFLALGYAETERSMAPPAIRATKQFSSICQASATLMSKRI